MGIHAFTQFLAGSEMWHIPGRHFDSYARLGIATCAWSPMVYNEAAKASYFDSSTVRQCVGYRINDFIDRLFRIFGKELWV